MMKRWCWATCLLLALAWLVAQAEVARCQEDMEQTVDRVCRHVRPDTKVRRLECRALVIMGYGLDKEKSLQEGIKLLKQAQAMAPYDLSILNNIALCYTKQKKYKIALQYFDQVLKMKPSFVEVKFFKCMLDERLGYPWEKCKECYKSVALHYKHRLQTNYANYVLAELMLGSSNAERVKKILTNLKPGSDEAEMWNELLGNFDREKFLHEMIP